MFNFIVNNNESFGATTATIIDGGVTQSFTFMNTDRGLDQVGGIIVNGECVRSNFTQHYDGGIRRFDTDSRKV